MALKAPQVFTHDLPPYLIAAILVLIVSALRWSLDPYLGPSAPYLLYTFPVFISAIYLGFKAAIFATVSGALLGAFFFSSSGYALQNY